MTNVNISYHNVDFSRHVILPNNNDSIISQTRKILKDLPSLNIVRNYELLSKTIQQATHFADGKETFIVFGTGGSSLGAKALINILQGRENKKIIFFDNIDPINFQNSINTINLSAIGFIVISKSGSTPETLSQFASIIEIFDQKNNLELLFSNVLVITENKISPLSQIAHANNCTIVKHEKNIGGRYAVFSNVGMIPSIIAGLDVKQIHAGALSAIDAMEDNENYKIAQFFRYQKYHHLLTNSVILTYSDALYYFGKWYLQLWAESLGKNKKGITAIHSVGATDQHSQLQLYLDGPNDKFFTFITTNHANQGLKLHSSTMKIHGMNYLVNKKMGDLMQAEQQATMDTFEKNNFAFREINLPTIDEYAIGYLMAISIIETVATCLYFDVEPFDQPAVEQGKILTKQYLS
ncbi:hypothetical protein OAJ74_03625 [Alphaproteobacteria bacterium]|nr:hypothetical protein [Alphaproteobacteria bacterium]